MKKLLLYLLCCSCLLPTLVQGNGWKAAASKESAFLSKTVEQEQNSYQDAAVYHHKPAFTRNHRTSSGFNQHWWNNSRAELFLRFPFSTPAFLPAVTTAYASWHTSYLQHNYPSHNFW